jgi:alcohol dehydrogenase class IV
MNSISDAVHRPTIQVRGQMAEAAFLAGKAINITKTTACHRIAPPITAHYGVPHGNAVGLTLAPMLIFNGNVNNNENQDSRGVDYVISTINEIANLIGANSIHGASQIISSLLRNIGLKTRLSEVGIKTNNDITKIIRDCYVQTLFNNNPRFLSEVSLRHEILDKIK